MTEDCGCRVDIFGRVSLCPLHKAAPAMLEALKGLTRMAAPFMTDAPQQLCLRLAHDAIKLAEVKHD